MSLEKVWKDQLDDGQGQKDRDTLRLFILIIYICQICYSLKLFTGLFVNFKPNNGIHIYNQYYYNIA